MNWPRRDVATMCHAASSSLHLNTKIGLHYPPDYVDPVQYVHQTLQDRLVRVHKPRRGPRRDPKQTRNGCPNLRLRRRGRRSHNDMHNVDIKGRASWGLFLLALRRLQEPTLATKIGAPHIALRPAWPLSVRVMNQSLSSQERREQAAFRQKRKGTRAAKRGGRAPRASRRGKGRLVRGRPPIFR